MQQRKIVCIVLMLCATLKVSAQNSYNESVRKYIEQYKDWAIEEQRRSGVPASITLAQGIHETNAGNSELALNANNHFGIKCKREWQGETYAYTDDAPDECFRKYSTALQSYKDHSDYLAGSKRYESLFKLSINDYKGWAHGLKRCGYATNPKYAHLLIKIVESYDLQQYTYAALQNDYNPVYDAEQRNRKAAQNGEIIPEDDAQPQTATKVLSPTNTKSIKKSGMSVSYGPREKPQQKATREEEMLVDNPPAAEYGKLVKVNGVKAFYAKKGTVLLEDAFRHNIRYAKLLEINELPDLPLEADMYVYLERKNPKGIHQTHIVKEGETLIQIAQAQAMQLRYLKYYNRIAANEEPMPGAVLQLQQYSENKPATYVKTVAPREESLAFAGSNPNAIPQGATRKRANYISKEEIKESQKKQGRETTDNLLREEKHAPNHIKPIAAIDKASSKKEPEITSSENATEKIGTPMPTPALISEKKEEQTTIVQTLTEDAKSEQPKSAISSFEETEPKKQEAARPVETTAASTDEKQKPQEISPQRKEEIEYDVLQPPPVIADNKSSKEKVTEEEIALPKTELIEPIAPVKTDIQPVKTEKVTVQAPAKKEVPQMPEEPKDEFDRLKQKLDKVVYAGATTTKETNIEVKKTEVKEEANKVADKKETSSSSTDASKIYTVKKGDTAFSIAKKHNITMRQLMDWNKLDFDKIKAGQKLRVKP